MINASADAYEKVARGILLTVLYEGTDTILQGEPLCYHTSSGTATDPDARRANRVVRPSHANAGAFAGVAARNYSGTAGVGPGVDGVARRLVDLYVPGSKSVPVALGVNTTINAGILTFAIGESGRFFAGKFVGRGSAVPRQTKTALLLSSLAGTATLGTDKRTLTIASTPTIEVGDVVILLGGANAGSGQAVVPGKYTVAVVNSATSIELDRDASVATPGGALAATLIVYRGNPTALCDLLDGEESGGVEFLAPPNAGGAVSFLPTGVTYVCGGITLAADATATLGAGAHPGVKKAFVGLGTLTTNDLEVVFDPTGIQLVRDSDGALVALAGIEIDAAAEEGYVQFNGVKWHLMDSAGAVLK